MAEHIQIGDLSPRIQYSGDGVLTAFAFPFPIFTDADMLAYVDGALSTPVVDYTVTGAGVSSGGTVTFLVPPANGTVITLRRTMAIARTSDFQESGEFRARVINDELDTLTALIQQVNDTARRALHVGPTDTALQTQLPGKDARAGQFLAFDSNGDPIAAAGAVDTLAVSPFGATLLGAVDATAARTALGALAPDGDGSTLSGIVTGATVSQKANIALNAFRIAVNGGLSVQNMVDGVVDEFEDESGVDTVASSNQSHDAAGNYYVNSSAPNQISQASGTAIGSLTDFAALSTAFDGVSSQLRANSTGKNPSVTGLNNFIGKDWGVGVTNTVSKFVIYGSSDPYPLTLGADGVKLQGSTDNFATSIVDLWSGNGSGINGEVLTVDTGIDISTAYRYHRIALEGDTAGGGVTCAELEFFEPIPPPDMNLQSNAFTALAQPDSVLLVLWHEFVDAVILNTDLIAQVSIDGGATWDPAPLGLAVSLTGNQQILTGTADVSARIGTSLKWRVSTFNSKQQRLRGVCQQWN